jgi:hypothetical protein
MLPTRLKKPISHTLSYPLSAKEISEALADTPQSNRLVISFYAYEPMDQRGEPRPILSVGYNGEERVRATVGFSDEWWVFAAPVPRKLRHVVNELLKKEALPTVRSWLKERQNIHSRFGAQSLSAIFDERTETLTMKHFQTPGETFSM